MIPIRLRLWRQGALVALSIAGFACGPRYGLRVPNDMVAHLPYESRIEMLEAENDLALAIDKLDEANNEVLRTRAEIRRSKSRRDAAGDEEWHAKDAVSKEVATLAIAEAEARVEYLRSRQYVNERNVDIEEVALRCAAAKYEAARLVLVRKEKIKGSESLRPEDFDSQVKTCELEVQLRRKDALDDARRAETYKAQWETKKVALARKTFDARASPYVE